MGNLNKLRCTKLTLLEFEYRLIRKYLREESEEKIIHDIPLVFEYSPADIFCNLCLFTSVLVRFDFEILFLSKLRFLCATSIA